MNQLSALQCRILGVMLEKEVTTPEQYPLSLNGLTNACNQKSNREPVMSLSEGEVQNVLDELMVVNLVSDQGAFGGRVAKYHHRFCNTEFGDLQLTKQQRAIVCVLFLRGPQTPGELRTRTNRLAEFANVTEVEIALSELHELKGEQYVQKLEREPGKRESRYAHLFSGDVEQGSEQQPIVSGTFEQPNSVEEDLLTRVKYLEQQVGKLTAQLAELLD